MDFTTIAVFVHVKDIILFLGTMHEEEKPSLYTKFEWIEDTYTDHVKRNKILRDKMYKD